MKTIIVIDILQPLPYLAKFWFSSNESMFSSNQIAGFCKM